MQRVQIGEKKKKGGVPARNLSPRDHFILFVINAEYATSCGSFLSGEGTSERGCGARRRMRGEVLRLCFPMRLCLSLPFAAAPYRALSGWQAASGQAAR